MTKSEMLKEVMNKAVKNGYKSVYSVVLESFPAHEEFIKNDEHKKFIFDTKFARAFWKYEKSVCSACRRRHDFPADCDCGSGTNDLKGWEFQLMNLVFALDHIEFLYTFIKK